eukprot:118042_1
MSIKCLDTQYSLNYNVNGPVTSDIIYPFATAIKSKADNTFRKFKLKRALIFYNPCAGGGASWSIVSDTVIPLFHESNISTIVYPTRSKGDLTRYLTNKTKQILSNKVDAFVVVGGDGTIHELINGYIIANYKAHNIAVILVNGGTGNALCLTVNGFIQNTTKLKCYLSHILQNIPQTEKKIQWMDVIQFSRNNNVVQYATQSYFGIPSAVTEWSEWYLFRRIFGGSSLRYDVAAVIEMCKGREYKLKFTFYGLQKQRNVEQKADMEEDKPLELITSVELFAAMKAKYFGSGMCITPFAKLDNGYLDVLILERLESRMKLISFFLRLQNIKCNMDIISEKGVLYYRCKELQIEVLDADNNIVTDVQRLKDMDLPFVGGDGELGPYLPLRLKAVQNAIPILFPNPKLF